MANINIGSKTLKSVYWGEAAVKRIYCGTSLIWSSEIIYTQLAASVSQASVATTIYNHCLAEQLSDFKVVKMKTGTYAIYTCFPSAGSTTGYTQYLAQTGQTTYEETVSYSEITTVLNGYDPEQLLIQGVYAIAPTLSVKIYYSLIGELYDWDFPTSPIGSPEEAQYMIEEEFFNADTPCKYIAFKYFPDSGGIHYRTMNEEMTHYEWSTWSQVVALGQSYDAVNSQFNEMYTMYGHTYLLAYPTTPDGTGFVWEFKSRA